MAASETGSDALLTTNNNDDITTEVSADVYGLFSFTVPADGSTPLIEITLDEQQRLLSTFTSLASSDSSSDSGLEELDVIPDFALSVAADLPTTAAAVNAVDRPSPADTLSTATSVSVASPPPLHNAGAVAASLPGAHAGKFDYSPPRGGIYDTAATASGRASAAVEAAVRRRSPFVAEQHHEFSSTPSKWLTVAAAAAMAEDWAFEMHSPIF